MQPPHQGNWVPTAETAGLGSKVDEALSNARELLGNLEIHYNDAGSKTDAKLITKIRNAQTFSCEFVRPSDMGSLGRIIGDGSTIRVWQHGKWSSMNGGTTPGHKMTDTDVTDFFTNISIEGFRDLSGKSQTWTRVVEALKKKVGGYTVHEEKEELIVLGKPRPILRLTGSRQSPSKAEFEIVVDGIEKLPLTVRFNQTLPDGKERKILLTCAWNTGGKHDDGSFEIPAVGK